jgi:hypothetical protein
LPAAGLLLLLACVAARAQGAADAPELQSREALRGVESVRLRFEFVPADGLPGAAAQDVMKGTAERLRAAGLRVILGGREAVGTPVFLSRVTLFTTNCGYAGTTDMQLREEVRLPREPEASATAATWQHVGRVQLYPPDPARLTEGLLSFVDVFVKEHRAAKGR